MLDRIKKYAGEAATKYGQELVDVTTASNSRGMIIRITVGSKAGPTVSVLTAISKDLRNTNEAEDGALFPDDCQIEVSSPGADRDLKTYKDFLWNEGRDLKLTLKDGEKNRHTEANLVKAFEDSIIIQEEDGEKKVLVEDIVKAKIKFKF
ncbi:MAG TPA: hypothetical protein PLK90_04655 [Clostridiales bacterium]|nr:hypothetical protein [Clostridiales bacterium]HQP69672.1 hypothetical protein [Clostridiales bacterium]